MSKKKKKYYTVWKGHHTGVFETWDDCKSQIKDFQVHNTNPFQHLKQQKWLLRVIIKVT